MQYDYAKFSFHFPKCLHRGGIDVRFLINLEKINPEQRKENQILKPIASTLDFKRKALKGKCKDFFLKEKPMITTQYTIFSNFF